MIVTDDIRLHYDVRSASFCDADPKRRLEKKREREKSTWRKCPMQEEIQRERDASVHVNVKLQKTSKHKARNDVPRRYIDEDGERDTYQRREIKQTYRSIERA